MIQQRRKNRNRYELICLEYIYSLNFSLKDFICDSSSPSDEEDPLEFYLKVNRLTNNDSSSRKSV